MNSNDNEVLERGGNHLERATNHRDFSQGHLGDQWYWWLKGKLSKVPEDFTPLSNDSLERIAWESIKYDHLGGRNSHHVLLTHLRPGVVKNPNHSWDLSPSASRIMKRVFQFQNLLHFITVLLHFVVLLPMTSTFLLTSGNRRRWIQFIIKQIKSKELK